MKIVVNKKVLDEFVASKVNEERSFHTKNVNELEKQQPPIFPQQQTSQQLTNDTVPVDDPEFKPVTQKELSQASQQIASKIESNKVQDFYTALKSVAKKYSSDPNQIAEARKLIQKILKEADEIDDLNANPEEQLTTPLSRAVDSILFWFSNLKNEEKQAYTMKPSGDSISIDSQSYQADLKIPRDAKEIVAGLMGNAKVKAIIAGEGLTSPREVEQVKAELTKHFAETGPDENRVTSDEMVHLEARKIVDMIYRDSDDKNDFYAKIKEKRAELAAAGNKRFGALVGIIGTNYLKKFEKPEQKDEIEVELPPEKVKKEKIPRTHLEVATFEETLDLLVQLRNEDPDKFLSLIKKLGVVKFNDDVLNLPAFKIEDFDDLPEDAHAYVVSLMYNDKDIRGEIYRGLQNFKRTAGIDIFTDKDLLPSYRSEEIEPGKFVIEAAPWKALPDDVAEAFYDVCVYDPIKNALLKKFNVDFKTFMTSINDKLEYRRIVKEVLYRLILTNRDEFEGSLGLWYKIHDNPAEKANILKKYKTEIDVLASTGFIVGATEIDQYFTNLKSANLDVYHLMHGILYSVALSEIHGMIQMGQLRPNVEAENFDEKQFKQVIDTMKTLFMKEDKTSFLNFIQQTVPLKLKMPSFMHLYNMTWEEFYGQNQKKIDSAIKEKLTSQPSQQGVDTDSLTFFDDLVNLTGSIGEEIDMIKDTLIDLLSSEMGAARQGGKVIYSSIPPQIGKMIVQALQIYMNDEQAMKDTATGKSQKDAVMYIINSLMKNKQAGGVAIIDPKQKRLEEAYKNIVNRLIKQK